MLRPVGMDSTISAVIDRCWVALWTSTIGDSPVTVIVSVRSPTLRSAFTVATKAPVSSMPWRCTVLNPGSANDTW